MKHTSLKQFISASALVSAGIIATVGLLQENTVLAYFAADPNTDREYSRHFTKTNAKDKMREKIRMQRRKTDHLHRAFGYPNATQFPQYKYRGHMNVVKDESDVVIPERCKRLKDARRARCVGIYLKDGVLYAPYKTRTRYVHKPKENHKNKRIYIRYNSKGPEEKLRLAPLSDDDYYIHGEEKAEDPPAYVPSYEEHGLSPESESEVEE